MSHRSSPYRAAFRKVFGTFSQVSAKTAVVRIAVIIGLTTLTLTLGTVTLASAAESPAPAITAKSAFTTIDAPGAFAGPLRGTAITAIDTPGDVAGIYIDANSQVHTFIRNVNGTFSAVEAPGSSTNQGTAPIAFDSAGDLMGIYMDQNGVFHGFLRAAAGAIKSIDVSDAGKSPMQGTFPASINAKGDVAGSYLNGNGQLKGFVRTAAGVYSTFSAPGALVGTGVVSINAAGAVVGTYVDANNVGHGFVRSADGTKITPFSASGAGTGGDQGTVAVAIDAAGDVGGAYIDANNVGHGFVRSASGTVYQFDAPGAGTGTYQGTYPASFDAAGDIVGLYIDANNFGHGFMRRANGTIATFDAPGTSPIMSALRRAAGQVKAMNGRPAQAHSFFSKTRGLLSEIGGVLGQRSGLLNARSNSMGSSGGVFNADGSVINGTLSLAVNPTGAVAGIYMDGEAVLHSFLRAATGGITIFDAPSAGMGVFQGTLAFTVNAAGTVAGTYLDQNSVLHGFVLTLVQAATTTTLSTSLSSPAYGQPVTLTAKVTSTGGVPPNGETIWFKNGATTGATQTLSNGTATLTTTALPGGADSVTAIYGGDINFAGGTSNTVSVTVGKAASTTKLTSSLSPSNFGQLVTFTAVVSGLYGGTAKGTATFKSGGVALGTAPLNGGLASFTTAAAPAGTDAITAVYSGDSNFAGSASNTLSQVVNKVKPTLTWAQPAAIPSGTALSATQLNAIATAAGTFVYSPAAGAVLSLGPHTLSVTYTPANATNYIITPITATVALQVTAAITNTPTVTVTPSPSTVTTAQVLAVAVAVKGATGKPVATGSVVLTSGSYISDRLTLSGGSTTIFVPAGSLPAGTAALTVNYTPDAPSSPTYNSAKGTSSVKVTQATIASGPATTLTVTSGGTAVTTVAAGSVVTLTATVKSGATAVTPGQVNFCDVAGVLCTDVHLLGTAQLNSTGTAVLKFRPGVGSYSYKAVFAGKKTLGTSASPVAKLTVTHSGLNGTATTIAQSGDIGNYTLTATVGGRGLTAPSGTIAFLDSSFGNAPLGTAALTASPMGLNWRTSIQSPVAMDYSNGTAIGDFNGDGIPDMAVVTFSYSNPDQVGSVAILLGNGDGSFTQLTSILLSDDPVSIAVGDFNGDGVQDLAISNLGSWNNGNAGYVTILLGKGDGTFKVQATRPATGYTSDALAVGDFNGDGVPDLAVVNEGSNANSYKSSVTILLGKGDGTFTATSPSPSAGSNPSAIVVGDFNGDSKTDLAVASQGSGALTILLGKGDGTFTPGAAPSAPVFSGYILAGDFNGDGKTDLVCGGASSIPLIILLGKGDGTFALAASQPQGVVPNFVSIGDFNGDGIPDLAAAGSGSQGTGVTILLGKGDGTFASAGFTTSNYPSSIATGDFDGDGNTDVVAVTGYNSSVTTLLTRTASAYATVSHISVAGPGPHQVKASYSGDSDYNSSLSIPTPLYVPTPKPAFSVAQGTYTTVQTVSITDATPGAKIFYSTNGYPPYPDSNPYLGPITVSSSQTIMAIAMGPGYGQSPVASATYTIQLAPAATPVISPGSGVYPSARSVTVSAASPGSTIYYTTNGTIPNTGSARYSGAIPVNTPMTLMAIAAAPGYTSSAVASAQYYFSAISMPLLYTIAGNGTPGYTGDNVPAAIADLNQPSSAVFDRAGNFYIADSANNRIRKIDATTGNVTTYAGNGTPGYSGDKGAATKAQLNFPNRIAIDSADNLYIPDINNYAVRKVTAATGVITTIAGTGIYGQSGCGLTGLATSAPLHSPGGVAVDAAGNVFIADQGCARILEIIKSTGNIVSVAGGGSNLSDNIQATTAKLLSPHSVAVDGSGNLYIAESSSHKIRKVTHATGIVSTVAGNGYGQGTQLGGYSGDGGPATAAELNWPTDAKVDNAGNIYIVDMQNNVVRKVTAATQKISTIAGNGFGAATAGSPLTCGYSGDGGLPTSAGLCAPSGVTVDAAGNLYISDRGNNVLRKVTVSSAPPASSTAAPAFTTSAGVYPNPQSVAITDATRGASIHFTMDGTVPTAASPAYNGPINVGGTVTIKAIAIATGYLQSAPVTTTYTITSPAALITTVAGSGVPGTINPAYGVGGNSAIGGAPLNANLGFISDLAIDGAGNIYLVDSTNNVVWMASVKTGLLSIVAGNGHPGYFGDGGPATGAELNYPVSVTVDNAGNLYIADENNNVIRKVSAQTGIITTFAGNGQCGDTGDGSLATSATLCIPANVRFDKDGNLYIADTGNYLIRKVDTKSGIISTFAGNETSYSGDGKAATMAGIENPYALAFDSIGNLYIGGGDGRVRKVTKSTGIITTVVGNGDIGYSGDGGPAANAEVNLFGLAFDSANNLYIANGPAAVRQVSPTGAITTIAGNGFCGFSGDGGSATIAQLCAPNAIALDAAGNLYIADSSNYRVRKVVPLKLAATPAFSLQSGTYTAVKTVTISDNTPNAKIYYTTNGTAPSTASSLYSGAIPVNQTTTINAIAAAAGYLNSAAATATYTIQQPQTISFTAPTTPVTYGVTPIALVASASSGLPIKFTVLSGPAAISAATLTITGAGTVVVTASQAGNNSYAAATTVSRTITVNKAAPALALAASAATAASGKSVTFTATITGSKTLPTGTVTFLDGTTQLGTGTLNSVGVATYATTKLSVATHNITASYPGDVNYLAKTSASVKVTISAL